MTSGSVTDQQLSDVTTTAKQDIRHAPVSKAIYGVITVLAVLQIMKAHPPSAWSGAVFLFGTTVAVALVDAYSESIAIMLAKERSLTLADLREIRHEVAPVLVGAQAPTILLIVSGFGLISVERAIMLAQVVAFMLLFSYGWRVGSLLHEDWLRRIGSGLILVGIGAIAVGIKAMFH
jgi:hemolysin III